MAEAFLPPAERPEDRPLPSLDDMPSHIVRVMTDAINESRGLITALEMGEVRRSEWYEESKRLLARYHGAAFAIGVDHTDFTPIEREQLGEVLAGQLHFLRRFDLEVQEADEFKAGWRRRMDSYAENIQQSWHRGVNSYVPFLPALPGEGTQCHSRCKCKWQVVTMNAERGDYDLYWRLGATRQHCQTCPARAATWNPYKLRGGVPAEGEM